ncbi:MAG: prevent-host-death protein [Rhizobium sp.]|nr:prevent-host-death protein [Rhizobium sp.]
MTHINVSDFRQNLAAHLDEVEKSRAPLFVTRSKGKAFVVLSEEEYESMAETLHLMSNPHNAEHIRASIAELDTGKVVIKDASDYGE